MPIRFAYLLFLATPLGFAGTWQGVLVDSSCYESELRNVSESYGPAERDVNMEVRACKPSTKTKNFGVALTDSDFLKLDATANSKAAQLVENVGSVKGKKTLLDVTVSGDMNKNVISVASISVRLTE